VGLEESEKINLECLLNKFLSLCIINFNSNCQQVCSVMSSLDMHKDNICIVYNGLPLMSVSGLKTDPLLQLARILLTHHFSVHLLFICQNCSDELRENLESLCSDMGSINLHIIYLSEYENWYPVYLRKAKVVYEFFMNSSEYYNVVVFPESEGIGYLCLKCKNTISSLLKCKFGVICLGPIQWKQEFEGEPIGYLNAFIGDFEKACVSLSDFFISPSESIVNWMLCKGWTLPDSVHIIPHIIDTLTVDQKNTPQIEISQQESFSEFVYYGRLNNADGVQYFIEAVSNIPSEIISDKIITFISPDLFDDKPLFKSEIEKIRSLVCEIRIIAEIDYTDIISYIKAGKRLLIIPSLANISSPIIHICLKEELPFLCSDQGGQIELISPLNRERFVFSPRPHAIANKIVSVIQNGIISPVIPSELFLFAEKNIQILFRKLVEEGKNRITIPPLIDMPLVTIVITTYNRSYQLSHAVESAIEQTYKNTEILIVDDGSNFPDTLSVISEIQKKYPSVRVITQENKYLGSARNTGAQNANGEYIVFLDDDDLLFPNYIITCIDIAWKEQAPCVIPATWTTFPQTSPICWISAGGGFPGELMPTSIIENTYGSSCILVKRELCKDYPYLEVFRAGWEDWSFLMNLHLSGIKLAIYPRSLFNYIITNNAMNQITPAIKSFHTLCKTLEKHEKNDIALISELFCFCETPNHAESRKGMQKKRDELLKKNLGLTQERDELLKNNLGLTQERDELLKNNSGIILDTIGHIISILKKYICMTSDFSQRLWIFLKK